MSSKPEYLEKSLQELENSSLVEITYASDLVNTCYRLYATPLKDFDPGDLRIMIGQGFGLEYLVPLAMDQLEINPWIDATFFEGDLLKYVIDTKDFWKDNPNLKLRMDKIVRSAEDVYLKSEPCDGDWYDRSVLMAIEKWSK